MYDFLNKRCLDVVNFTATRDAMIATSHDCECPGSRPACDFMIFPRSPETRLDRELGFILLEEVFTHPITGQPQSSVLSSMRPFRLTSATTARRLGTTAVEVAVTMPVFLAFAFGLMEASHAMMVVDSSMLRPVRPLVMDRSTKSLRPRRSPKPKPSSPSRSDWSRRSW